MSWQMSWEYFALIIGLVVVLNILVGAHARLKAPKYEKKPEFSWDQLQNDDPGKKRDE